MTGSKKPTKKQLATLRRAVEAIAGKPIESFTVVRGWPRRVKVN